MSRIDAHTLFGFWPLRRADVSVEALLATLHSHGIDRALTASTGGIFADFARGNEETLQVCAEHPELVPVGTVDPRRYVGTLEEIDRCREQGVRFWRLYPRLQDWPMDMQPVHRILERLGERGLTLMVDAGQIGEPSRLAALTGRYNLRTLLIGVTSLQVGELLAVLPQAEHVLVETRRLADPQIIRALAERFGAERLVFGSASPLQYVSSATLPLEASGLDEAQRERILGGNLEALLAD